MKTGIIDYGMGNLLSVKRAFEACNATVVTIVSPTMIKDVDHLVLPGVGAYKDGMKNLVEAGWVDEIKSAVECQQTPILGICLGMQLLADIGYENGETSGLKLIPGEVRQLGIIIDEKLPHVGWNEVKIINDSPLFSGIDTSVDFYFVHSYHFIPRERQDIIAITPYGNGFVSAVGRDNVFGVQFHPEKSHRPGLKLISNFLKL
ncbi:imidazole glycerol phosphate synthase subunit HisH [Acetobacterium malicum]|uniref:Imidazole glycerol phosphate synthase subunit HisH n=1 Tax=Acetobacterium malicum TaxID=52692 RepID=A0ABR6YVC1_9FIRM|nr:imidazole glycerol phosphate synthase subunit HisH [Acetobacterium malicum]MBC3899062.1 imidazole glycerol phosphate synthase subunit HisH [Acetobacterium malicum]